MKKGMFTLKSIRYAYAIFKTLLCFNEYVLIFTSRQMGKWDYVDMQKLLQVFMEGLLFSSANAADLHILYVFSVLGDIGF